MIDFGMVIDSLNTVVDIFDRDQENDYFSFSDKDKLKKLRKNFDNNRDRIKAVLFDLKDLLKTAANEDEQEHHEKSSNDLLYEDIGYILSMMSGRGWPRERLEAMLISGADPISIMQALMREEDDQLRKKQREQEDKDKAAAEYRKQMEKILANIRQMSSKYKQDLITGYTNYYSLLAELNHVKSQQKLVGLKIDELNIVSEGLKERFAQHTEEHNAKLVALNNVQDRIAQNNLRKQQVREDKQRLTLLKVEKTNGDHELARLEDQIEDAITRHAFVESVDALEHAFTTKKAALETVSRTISQLEYSIPALEAQVQREDQELAHLSKEEEIAQQVVAEKARFKKISDRFAKFFSKNERELSSLMKQQEQLDARIRQLEPQVAEAKRVNDAKMRTMQVMEEHARATEDELEIPEEERISTMVSRDRAEAKQKELDLKLKELEGRIRDTQDQIEDVKEELSRLDKEIERYRADGVPEHDFEEKIIKQEAKKKTIASLKTEVDNLEAEKNALQIEISQNNANPSDPIADSARRVADAYGRGYVQPSDATSARHGNPILNGFDPSHTTPQVTPIHPATNTPNNRRPNEEGRDPGLSPPRH